LTPKVVELIPASSAYETAQVHPHQVLREVARVRAARLRVDRDQCLPGVVLTGQQRAHLELVDLGPQRGQVAQRLLFGGLVALALGRQFEQHLGVAQPLVQAVQPGQLRLQVGQPAVHLLRAILIGPKPRVGGLLAQAIHLRLHDGRIEHRLDAGELGRQSRDLVRGIDTCHGE
jgi:hypothetical protein